MKLRVWAAFFMFFQLSVSAPQVAGTTPSIEDLSTSSKEYQTTPSPDLEIEICQWTNNANRNLINLCASQGKECIQFSDGLTDSTCRACKVEMKFDNKTMQCKEWKSCQSKVYANQRFVDFCASVFRECVENEDGVTEPTCRLCPEGTIFNPTKKQCQERLTCQSRRTTRESYADACASLWRECVEPVDGLKDPYCRLCTSNETFNYLTRKCQEKKTCQSEIYANQKFVDLCASVFRECVEPKDSLLEPTCRVCPEGTIFDPTKNKCQVQRGETIA